MCAYDRDVPSQPDSLSALPSTTARILAFIAILMGGLAGGFIGFALVDVQCTGNCSLPLSIGIILGSTISAGGTAIVAVLGLRALGEWREISDNQ
jgi:hypothetical protein